MPDRIEIAQQRGRPTCICRGPVGDDALDNRLGASIDIDCCDRVRLVIGQVMRRAIDGGGGRKDDAPASSLIHRLQQADRSLDIGAVIAQRLVL